MVTAAMKLKYACSLEESYDQPRQHIKNQRHYFADKGPSSQSLVFPVDTKGTFHAKMGSIKDRNGMDLTVAEDIKKRWQQKNYTKKILMTQRVMMV